MTFSYKRYLAYLKYILIHKYYAITQGIKRDVNLWQLITHDLSKFRPLEFIAYAQYYYEQNGNRRISHRPQDLVERYYSAWNQHQKLNRHHWQFWVLTLDGTGNELMPKYPNDYKVIVLDMPLKYRKEMLADWDAAGLAINGNQNTKNWYYKNRDNIILSQQTREWVEIELDSGAK